MKSLKLILLIVICNCVTLKSQTFVNVKANGLNNGTSWVNAYTDLVTALSNTESGEIWVAKGIYYPENDTKATKSIYKSFRWEKEVSLIGGFSGNENSKEERKPFVNFTILSGDLGNKNDSTDNSIHVVYIKNVYSPNSVLDGFIITGGYYEDGWENASGAGIYAQWSGAYKIRNCIIMNNYSLHGGGMFIDRCNPTIENNIIYSNIAFEGAGILFDYGVDAIIKDNLFINNQAIDYPKHGNSANNGGAISINAYVNAHIEGNTFLNNRALNEGGAIDVNGNYTVNIINNFFGGNYSNEYGGGIFISNTNAKITNNIIARNEARYSGGGLHLEDHTTWSELSFSNNTVVFNKSGNNGGGMRLEGAPTIYNSIFYYNTSSNGSEISIDRDYGISEFSNNIMQNGIENIAIYNNHNNDTISFTALSANSPLFLDTLNNDFQLKNSSPAINGGIIDTSGLNLPSTDVLDNERIFNDTIDIGAIEYYNSNTPQDNFINTDSIDNMISLINLFIKENTTYQTFKEISICQGDSILLENTYQYTKGTYYDTLKHIYGGDSIVITQLTINECVNDIIPINKNKNLIYPNPCKDFFIVKGNHFSKLQLFKIDGILLYEKKLNNDSIIDISFLEKGIYIIILDNQIKEIVIKQ